MLAARRPDRSSWWESIKLRRTTILALVAALFSGVSVHAGTGRLLSSSASQVPSATGSLPPQFDFVDMDMEENSILDDGHVVMQLAMLTGNEDFEKPQPTEKLNLSAAPLLNPPAPATPSADRSLASLFNITHIPVTASRNTRSFGEQAKPVESINLGQTLSLAVDFSRDVRMANARLDTARAQTGQATSLLLPSLTLRASRGKEKSAPASEVDPVTGIPKASDTHNRRDTTTVLKIPVMDLPGIYDRWRRQELELSREHNVRSTEGDAAIAAVEAYLSVASSRLQADLAMEFEKQLKELLEYLRKRADAGASTVSDLDRVRARVLTAYATRLEQEAAHAAAGIDFARVVNVIPARLQLPAMSELGSIPPDFEDAIAAALQNNPDVAALQLELDAAETDRKGALATLAHRVDLELSDFRVVNAGGDTGLQHDQRLMLVANWALYEGGRSLRLHDERSARRQESYYRLDDTRRRLIQTLSGQYAILASLRDRIFSGYAELDALKAALQAVSERMLSGNQSLLDLLDVYDRVYQVRVRLVNLHVQEFTSVARIIRNINGSATSAPPAADAPLASSSR